MCGSSKSTAPPPSPPPTTFSYTAADRSNAQQRQAAMVGSTTPTLGSELGTGGASPSTGSAMTGAGG